MKRSSDSEQDKFNEEISEFCDGQANKDISLKSKSDRNISGPNRRCENMKMRTAARQI